MREEEEQIQAKPGGTKGPSTWFVGEHEGKLQTATWNQKPHSRKILPRDGGTQLSPPGEAGARGQEEVSGNSGLDTPSLG